MWRPPVLAALVHVCCAVSIFGVSAQDSRSYGARGRTIVQAGVQATASNLAGAEDPFHETKWSAGARLTLLQFLRNNVAVGGTLFGGASQHSVAYEAPQSQVSYKAPSSIWTGGDVDVAFHLPMSKRLSLRFWLWSGVRYGWYTFDTDVDATRDQAFPTPRSRYGRASLWAGLHANLLIHLSRSLAVYLGPSISLRVVDREGLTGGLSLNHGLTYSFGPLPEEAGGVSRLDAAPRFSSRERNVIWGGLDVGVGVSASLGYARFIRDGVGLGGYVTGRYLQEIPANPVYWAGAGAQLLLDTPIAPSFSILSLAKLGYMWRGAAPYGQVSAHELQAELPVLVALHLNEALVLGIGPSATVHVRLAQHAAGPGTFGRLDDVYLAGGLSSALLASF